MCEYAKGLIAWMDGELTEGEAAEVEQHVKACVESQAQVAVYEDASRDFAAYYDATTQISRAALPKRRLPRWVPVVAAMGAVAALLLLALLPRAPKPAPPVRQMTVATTSPARPDAPASPLKPAAKRHVAAHRKSPATNWAMADPAIQIAIPADSMFPPGAVPEGVNYVADLSLTDGSLRGIRLQP